MVKIPIKTVKANEQDMDEAKLEQEVPETESSSAEEIIEETPTSEVEETVETVDESPMSEVETDEVQEAEAPSEAEPETPEEEDELSRLKKELEVKTQEAKDQYDARLRLQAELDNFKKRKEREILDFRKYANEDFIRELLIVVDDFDRAIAAAEQTHKLEDFLQGVELIFDKFLGVLRKKGIKEIEAKGQPFNPEIHEAVMQVETDDFEEGTVVDVFQKGYYLHDRVILAPKAFVSKETA